MRESLIRCWAAEPWHCWLKEAPPWIDILAEILVRLPQCALEQLLAAGRPLVLLPPVNQGRIVRMTKPLANGANIMQLDERLLGRPRSEAIGILTHELAHAYAADLATDDELTNDLEADRLAIKWGFGKELLAALERDLEANHPRTRAARAA